MRSMIISGVCLFTYVGLLAQSNWQTLTTPARSWVQVSVADPETMYAVSELWGNSIYETMLARSADGGMTWDSVNTFYLMPMGLEFFDANNGHLLGGIPSCGLYSGMMNITDGGTTLMQRDYYSEFYNIGTVNLQTSSADFGAFYIAGSSQTVYHTVDTGATLLPILSQPSNDWMFQTELSDVRFVSPTKGFVCGYRMLYDSTINNFNHHGLLFVTEDGGTTWAVDSFATAKFLSMHMVNANQGFAFSPSHLASTTDGGNSWTIQELPFNGTVFQAVDEAHCFAVDIDGKVWETYDSGTFWVQSLIEQNIRDIQCKHGVCLAGGDNGSMFKTTFVTGTDDNLLPSSFALSPNPATAAMIFTTRDAKQHNYRITDIVGRTVATGVISSGENIDISRLPSADYVFSVEGLGGQIFTVQH